MSAKALYRIASVLLLIFTIGHTVGFLRFRPPTAEGRAVFDSMEKVQFVLGGKAFTYGQFYEGFGLFATAYLLFAAYLAWWLGRVAASNPRAIRPLAWTFFVLQVASIVLCWMYFLLPPVILSAFVAVCTGWAAWGVDFASRQTS
jgi:hypothetical protein